MIFGFLCVFYSIYSHQREHYSNSCGTFNLSKFRRSRICLLMLKSKLGKSWLLIQMSCNLSWCCLCVRILIWFIPSNFISVYFLPHQNHNTFSWILLLRFVVIIESNNQNYIYQYTHIVYTSSKSVNNNQEAHC